MLNVVCNQDLPDTIFEVKEEVILHVTRSMGEAIKYSEVDMMVLMDIDWKTKRYLKSIEFEVLINNNPKVSFLIVAEHSSVYNFVNDMTIDYPNLDVVEARDLNKVKIRYNNGYFQPKISIVDMVNSWFEQIFGIQEKAKAV